MFNGVPWKVVEQIQHDRYTTRTQGANRFLDSADLRARGPDELELHTLGYDTQKKRNLVITRMQGAIDQMKAIKKTQAEISSKPLIAQTIADSDSKSLERVTRATNRAPRLQPTPGHHEQGNQ